MSDHRAGPRSGARGQTLVEFALVLPILLVILLGVVDFGRVFSASIAVEASARNGAEVGALERLRDRPSTDPSTWTTYYTDLHEQVAKVVCSELGVLPNATFSPADRTCATMPVVRVCVRDGQDPMCGYPIDGFASLLPPECDRMAEAWDNSSGPVDVATGDSIGSHAVEVRVCYQFTTLFHLHFSLPGATGLDLGNVWIQRNRVFVLDCPPGPVASC